MISSFVLCALLFPFVQGVCPQINGAITGAVSTSRLDSVGVKWALAGHSERRVIFGETDEYINGQCKKLIDQGMAVMLCIGESEAEYEQNLAGAVCAVQLKKGLAGIAKEDLDRVAIACKSIRCWSHGAMLKVFDEWTSEDRISFLPLLEQNELPGRDFTMENDARTACTMSFTNLLDSSPFNFSLNQTSLFGPLEPARLPPLRPHKVFTPRAVRSLLICMTKRLLITCGSFTEEVSPLSPLMS